MEDADMERFTPVRDGDETEDDLFMDFEPTGAANARRTAPKKTGWSYGDANFVVEAPAVQDRKSYQRDDGEFVVARIQTKNKFPDGSTKYQVEFGNGSRLMLSYDSTKRFENGREMVRHFNKTAVQDDSSEDELASPTNVKRRKIGDTGRQSRSNESEDSDLVFVEERPRQKKKRRLVKSNQMKISDFLSGNESDEITAPRRTLRPSRTWKSTKNADFVPIESVDLPSEIDEPTVTRKTRSKGAAENIQIPPGFETDNEESGSRTRRSKRTTRGKAVAQDESDFSGDQEASKRRSGRTKNHNGRPNYNLDDFEEYVVVKEKKPKAPKITEVWPTYAADDPFCQFHLSFCQSCGETEDQRGRKKLVYCQGCCFAYHPTCIGTGSNRRHKVTLLDTGISVLQCINCINKRKEKDPLCPDYDMCAYCNTYGQSCKPFSNPESKSSSRSGSINGDAKAIPEVSVPDELLNSAENIMFRCIKCRRGYHFECLPPVHASDIDPGFDDNELRKQQLEKYTDRSLYGEIWHCLDCRYYEDEDHKIDKLVGWKPTEDAAGAKHLEEVPEHQRLYLVKLKNMSYHHLEWKHGYWIYNVLPQAARTAFIAKDYDPVDSAEEAVPPEFLTVELILDTKMGGNYKKIPRSFEDAMAQIDNVKSAYVKYVGLGFEDVVWNEAPAKDDPYYEDFKIAYANHVRGYFVRPSEGIQEKVRNVRAMLPQFDEELKLKEQPTYIKGGKLMGYQEEGVNWLYKKWVEGQNCLLSDEMGLGKTIQIVSFLSVLQMRHEIWPFLVVVPMSTVPNWRREILKWVPDMRVVTYSGGAEGRKLTSHYDMFDDDGKLKCHIVISEYGTIRDDNTLKKIKWQCLIADEAQRLKNDESMIFKALDEYKAEHRVLMTGTPLQNNIRELLNLLQFVDRKNFNARKLEETEYNEITAERVRELREVLKKYQIRRTKAQVLGFLPPVIDVIVPLTMTPLQKRLYKSILEKEAKLIHQILRTTKKSGKKDRAASLNNILMQLRKTLCHPFIYNADVEETGPGISTEMRFQNLVNASAKFQFLSTMLPALRERGHRVLMFSQFLGMLDFVGDLLDHMDMPYARIDGSDSSLARQKRIDAYNEPNSELFAFLLSTRAGGVGINLATADTVIILDPDFNPHQDMQALARAHRIGQKKPVRVFFLMTRSTAEEKIMERGKKKMSLDHVIIEMKDEDEDDEGIDSILQFGAKALFDENDEEEAIRYDSAKVKDLLDRTVEPAGLDEVSETGFKYAHVWTQQTNGLVEMETTNETEEPMSEDMWLKIIQEREELAKKEQLQKEALLGRGHRRRANEVKQLSYREHFSDPIGPEEDIEQASDPEYDSDFRNANAAESESEAEIEVDGAAMDLFGKQSRPANILPPGRAPNQQQQHQQQMQMQQPGPPVMQMDMNMNVRRPNTQPGGSQAVPIMVPDDAFGQSFRGGAPRYTYSDTPPPTFAPGLGLNQMAPVGWGMTGGGMGQVFGLGAAGLGGPGPMPPMGMMGMPNPAMRPTFRNDNDPMLPGFSDASMLTEMNRHVQMQPAQMPPLILPSQPEQRQEELPMEIDEDDRLPSPIPIDGPEAQLMSDIFSTAVSNSKGKGKAPGGFLASTISNWNSSKTPKNANDKANIPSASTSKAAYTGNGRPRTTLLTEHTTPTKASRSDATPHRAPQTPITVPPGTPIVACAACSEEHPRGFCPLMLEPLEECPLCRVPHVAGTDCDVFRDLSKLKEVMKALKQSDESPELVNVAKAYILGRIGGINRVRPGGNRKGLGSTSAANGTSTVAESSEVGESLPDSGNESTASGKKKRGLGRPRKSNKGGAAAVSSPASGGRLVQTKLKMVGKDGLDVVDLT